MDLPHKTAKIGAHEYRATALPLDDWGDYCEFLARVLGEPAGAFLKGFQVGDLQDLLGNDTATGAKLLDLAQHQVTKHNILEMCHHMGPGLAVRDEAGEWQALSLDRQKLHWAYYRGELPGVVILFARAQLEDFFSGVGALLPKSAADTGTRSATPSAGAPLTT